MNKHFTTILLFFAVTLSLLVTGCGSKDSQKASFTSNASSSKVFGVASLDTTTNGTVSVKDTSVPKRETTTSIDSHGNYTVDVSGLKAPFILKASGTDQAGNTQSLYSVSKNGGRANINQISDTAVAASANATATNMQMADSWSNNDDNHMFADNFDAVINSLRTLLAPLFALYNVSGNPVTEEDGGERDGEHATSGLSALLHDVRFTVTHGNVIVTSRATGGIIFSGPLNNLASGTFYPENMPAVSGGSTTCTSFTYSGWGTCQPNGTQTQTVLTSLPAGCTGGTPVLSQACTYVPPVNACTSFTYSGWGTCQPNGTQTQTVLTSLPAGCTGGTPVLSQSCTYVPPVTTCTSFTYSGWGACQPNGTQTQTVLTSLPAGCTGGTPVLSQACTYVPPVLPCTSFTYSGWGACQPNGTQTQTVLTSLPAGCTGGTPLVSQSCTYVDPIMSANVKSSCTGCHGLTSNTTVFKSGGYTILKRNATDWLTTVDNMVGLGASLAAGKADTDYANFLATVP